jgi:hypothetical protein
MRYMCRTCEGKRPWYAFEKTRKAYQQDIPDFTTFLRITQPEESTTPEGEC